MMELEAIQLERAHVHNVYEQTAPYFTELRSKAWPRVRQFLLDQGPGSLIADIGCGIGKYLTVNTQAYTLGSDYCSTLLEIAKRHGHEVMVCDNLMLPFRDQCFNAVVSIGVIHHFSTKERRIRAISEMARTLRPGGQIMIYVWAMEQKQRRFEKQDIFVPWNKSLCSRPPSESGQSNSNNKSVIGSTVKAQELKRAAQSESSAVWAPSQDGSYTTDNYDPFGSCCLQMSHQQEHRFYKHLGRSLRSWFFSKSLDEATMRSHIEQLKSRRNLPDPIHTWTTHPVSMQPQGNLRISSLHCSLETVCPQLLKGHSFEDDEVFVENLKHDGAEWPEHSHQRSHRVESYTNGGLDTSQGHCVEGRQILQKDKETESSQGGEAQLLKRTLPSDTIANCGAVALEDKQVENADDTDFMRYYHVFREGELSQLIEENVSELHILSSCYDHGNWCVIAEKES
ncbi:probable tRNA methyltransferase 9B isoform X2 [Callorhinchus milii]|uniref:probable tRNA methyltransferase 9B isoform X2 n=1 Tax=Callorhinchus milii TaxID=7868 RepID=UPI00045749B8|nr:probable tRNA methyltransferase 9B isoform X2 [Callorhinchus milii]XP_007890973.1 probable tRNA methyltransferase 9B isoform X2 [Callorhinchus milii]XP_007890974.1 probable tRNA methyltransferase 9B isoform X2 [Callorhinchus milii]XP_007890975.1 probable tRNA methyltransferase 9B isoform X2 [Callorhinchus milii]|eukprot:gi/632950865/ref/XP_007890970.1/ PREDICTED: putative methyltransferase KIAA1456 homolog isoform X2 [Callorhinchus milii]